MDGGIVNIPFIRQYADAKSLESTFWARDRPGRDHRATLLGSFEYSQTVDHLLPSSTSTMTPGLIKWPHVTVNTADSRVNRRNGPERPQVPCARAGVPERGIRPARFQIVEVIAITHVIVEPRRNSRSKIRRRGIAPGTLLQQTGDVTGAAAMASTKALWMPCEDSGS